MFGTDALYINWRGRHEDAASQKWRVSDGLLWLPAPENPELWLVELEWKLGSNYLQQAQAFAEARVPKKKLLGVLRDSLKNAQAFGTNAQMVDAICNLTMKEFYDDEKGVLKPNMWVVLGHEKNDTNYLDNLRRQYIKVTKGFFGDDDTKYIVTMVRWFCGDEKDFFLLENYKSLKDHYALLVPIYPPGRESVRVASESSPPDEQKSEKTAADETWDYLKETYKGLQKGNVRLRLQPDFDCFKDFEIAWDKRDTKKNKYVYIRHKGKDRLPGRVAGDEFGDRKIPRNCAEKWGWYVDVSENPKIVKPKSYNEVIKIIAAQKSGKRYDPEHRRKRPLNEFFGDDAIYPEIKKMTNLWETLLKGRVCLDDWIELTGYKELTSQERQGRSASIDHVLINYYPICERVGDEFRLTDEAVPFVRKMLAYADKKD